MELKVFEADNLVNKIEPMLKDAKGIVAYGLAKDLRLLADELKEYTEKKTELFKKYGEEKDNMIVLKPENIDKFNEEMNMFKNEKIFVNLRKFSEEELANSGLNGEQMFLLSSLFEE